MYLDKYKLEGRVAVVTGGGRAIGRACVQALAEAGARVVIADHDPAIAAEGQAEMRKAGHSVEVMEMDVTKPDQVTQAAAAFSTFWRICSLGMPAIFSPKPILPRTLICG